MKENIIKICLGKRCGWDGRRIETHIQLVYYCIFKDNCILHEGKKNNILVALQ